MPDRISDLLLAWYDQHARTLPWRGIHDPYRTWVSETMLQQTRVEAVKGYYARFLSALPDIQSLANCDDEMLHKLWEGLGYYSRVRNLKKAAQVILSRHNGQFPQTHKEILALPGIGDYTAGAISSIAFNQPTPAVDGNVLRVVSRLTEDETPIDLPARKKEVTAALEAVDTPVVGLCFINRVDFDSKYGHRQDVDGYAAALSEFDAWLGEFLPTLGEEDVVMITADHGCDPGYDATTDHTREYVPLLVLGKQVKPVNLGTRTSFADIAATVTELLGVNYETQGKSFAKEILK